MNLLSKLNSAAKIGLVFGVFAAAISGVNLISNHFAQTSAASSCAAISVIYCGLNESSTQAEINSVKSYYDNNTSGHPTAFKDIKTIYNYVGANQALIDSMTTANTIPVTVYKNGNVTNASGKIIATDAMSVGRFRTTSSVRIGSTNAYFRPTSESFADSYLTGIARIDSSGKIIFGSLGLCGNPFSATPVPTVKVVAPVVVTPTPAPTPDYAIVKEVAVKGSTTYAPSLTVNYGTHVVYRITVTSTGAIPVRSVATNDVLPSGIKYVIGTIAHDGFGIGTTLFESVSMSDGYRIASLDNGSSTVLTFEAIVGPNDSATSCTPETINNTATITQKVAQHGVSLLLPKSSTATVYKTCIVPVIVKPPVTTTPVTTTVVTPPVTTPTVAPVVATCTNLSLLTSTLNPGLVTASVTYTASTGVALTNVAFNWSDGYLTSTGVTTTAQHTYTASGTYNVIATLSFTSGSTALPQSICQLPITINIPTPVAVVKPTSPAPTTLVNTGPGSNALVFLAATVLGTIAYRSILSRRFASELAE